MPKGALGSWITKASNPVFGGSPDTSRCMFSTGPSELMVTRPLAFAMQFAATAPEERTMLKVVFVLCAKAVTLAKASRKAAISERVAVFMEIPSFFFLVLGQ